MPLQGDYARCTAPFRGPREPTRVRNVRTAVSQLLDEALEDDPEARYGPELAERVRDALRASESPWQEVKKYGTTTFRGEAAPVVERLLGELEKCGVVPVRVGELEGFALTLGVRKGKERLPAALRAGAHRGPAAQEHVRRLLAAGGYQ